VEQQAQLGAQATLVEKVICLHGVELLSSLAPEQLARIALIAREKEAPKSTVLLREREISDCMYIIMSGKVAVDSGGDRLLVAGEKEVIGTWALLEDQPMLVTATVLEDARLLCIERGDFYELLADHSEITQAIFQALVRRIRKLVEQ
jgi:CRP/FNR family cyclic AMP-dependent transcriptional regulator